MGDRSLLRQSSLGHIRTLQHVVILKETASIEQVLKTLAHHKIVSAPVVSNGAEPGSPHCTWPQNETPKSVAGFIDVKRIINRFLGDIADTDIMKTSSMLKKMRSLELRGQEFSKKTIKELGLTGGDGSFLHVTQDHVSLLELAGEALLSSAIRAHAHGEGVTQVVHRVAIFDSNSHIVNIISQSDIVRYLLENEHEIGDIKHQDIAALKLGFKPVISVPPEMSAIEALKVVDDNHIGAVAVVNSTGKIIGNFSAADMRTITAEHFGSLALPVGEFLALEHGTEYSGFAISQADPEVENISTSGAQNFARDRESRSRPKTPRHPGAEVGQILVICKPSDTLLEVMHLLVVNKVHRIFIVDEEMEPVGVLTCTDILRKLVELEKC
ncbi:hypothetical protein BSKO_12234 [Bryopsis sp. KO-2023]|nr:hypothetical protein BSKO_12234 [Bryopsis sp. KO-2023]